MKSNGEQLLIKKRAEGDTDFKIIEGNTASPSVLLNTLGTFFEDMNVEDVHAASNFEFPDDATITTFTTFNGLIITVKNVFIDDKAFAHFSFTTTATSNNSTDGMPENESETISAEEESQLWNQFLGHWVYEIPEFKLETLDVNVAQSAEELKVPG